MEAVRALRVAYEDLAEWYFELGKRNAPTHFETALAFNERAIKLAEREFAFFLLLTVPTRPRSCVRILPRRGIWRNSCRWLERSAKILLSRNPEARPAPNGRRSIPASAQSNSI